jgi:polysaccharide deacetylase 2 family uncharacterized protein YibQ
MLRKNKQTATGRSGGTSLLSFLYGLLFLTVAGGAGWITYLDYQNPGTGLQLEAQTEIAAVTLGENPEKPEELARPEDVTAEAESDPKPIAPTEPMLEDVNPPENTSDTDADQEAVATSADIADPTEKPDAVKEKTAEVKDLITAESAAKLDPEQATETKAAAKAPRKTEPELAPVEPETTPVVEKPVTVEPAPEKIVALAPVPDPELAKKSDFGLLPIIGPDGKMPWRTYARPFDDPLARPRIAIIMSEMGMSSSATKTAIQKLPGAVTLSFNPYARDLQNWIGQARAAGHEVLLQLPMEPFGYPNNDPGPHSLLTSLTDRENLNRLDWMLGRFTGYSGVTNQMGSRFTSSLQDMTPIMTVLKDRGLLFLDGRTSSKSISAKVATQLGMPVAVNNRFLDHKADRATIDKRLAELEKIARFTGSAVGVGYPYPVTMERIAVWAQSLNRKGIVLAPISAIVNRQEIQ